MEQNFEYIEGIHAVDEALVHNVPIKDLLIGNYLNINTNRGIAEIIKKAKSKNVKVKKVDKSVLQETSIRGGHQGIIAKIEGYKYSNINDVLNKVEDKTKSLIVILDHIEDAGNLGAIARSAEAFGADAIIIPNKRSTEVKTSTYKTSAGAICNIDICKVANVNAAIEQLKKSQFWIAAASEHADDNIWNANLKGKIAIVMGSEHNGVSSLVLKNSDFIIKLPLYGDVESLNVAQAFTACAYEWVRQNA